MKKTIWAVFLIGILSLAAPAQSEIYKYIDENGQKRWTDDLSQVPKDQRPSGQRLVTEETQPIPGDTVNEQAQKNPLITLPETEAAMPDTGGTAPLDELSRDALVKEKADLHELYRQLMDERKQLQQAIAEASSSDARAELEMKASEYNQKTEAYDSRLNNYNNNVTRYNKQISAVQEKASD